MPFCLIKSKADEFLRKIKNGELDVNKLSEMASEARRAEFMRVIGIDETTAKEVNALFESKLLLKYQKRGMINWIQKTGNLKEPAKRDLLSKVQRMENVLDPEDVFLTDLAEKRLGIGVSEDEANKIFELSNKADKLSGVLSTFDKKVAYGNAVLDLSDYADSLRPNKISFIQNVIGLTRSIKVIGDLGVPFRQGWGMMSRKEWVNAFGNMFKYLVDKQSFRNLNAEIVADPLYQEAKKGGLRLSALAGNKLSQREEDFMTTLVGKIPVVRGIERANVGFLTKLRWDVFKMLYKSAEMRGENVKDIEVLRDLASVVNNFSGSGNIGKADKYNNIVPILNNLFFSARKISATINMLNPATYIKGSKTARLAALRQLLGSLTITATVLGLTSLIGEDSETNPTSADFGKIKLDKKTRSDFTGGNGNYAVLLARLIKNQTKSSTSGKIYNLGQGYKPETRASLIIKFGANKLAPLAGLVASLLTMKKQKGKYVDYGGREVGLKASTLNTFEPMVINDVISLVKESKDNEVVSILGMLLNYFGNSTMSY